MALKNYLLFLILLLSIQEVALALPCKQILRWPVRDVYGQRQDTQSVSKDELWLHMILNEAHICLQKTGEPANIPRRLALLRSGGADLLAGASITPEREQYAYFSIAYREERLNFYALESDSDMKEIGTFGLVDALQGNITVGVFRGASYGPPLDRLLQEFSHRQLLREFNNHSQALDLISHQRVRLLLLSDMDESVWGNMATKIIMLPTTVFQDPVHLMFSKQTVNPFIVDEINAAILRLLRRSVAQK